MKKRPVRRRRKQKTPASKLTKGQVSLLTQAVENCTEMIGMCDSDGRITFVNRAFLQAFCFSSGCRTKSRLVGLPDKLVPVRTCPVTALIRWDEKAGLQRDAIRSH
jgi:PAS domain-containing protein